LRVWPIEDFTLGIAAYSIQHNCGLIWNLRPS
jgi:hypothetical protein